MTEYASIFRYPGDAEAPSGPEVKAAQDTASAVNESVLARLPDLVRPLKPSGGKDPA